MPDVKLEPGSKYLLPSSALPTHLVCQAEKSTCIYINPHAHFPKQTPKEPWGPSSFPPCAAGSLLIAGKTPWGAAGNLKLPCIYFRITTLLIKRAFSCDLCGEGEVLSLRQRDIAACCYAKMGCSAWLHLWKQLESSALTSAALNSPADVHTEGKKSKWPKVCLTPHPFVLSGVLQNKEVT